MILTINIHRFNEYYWFGNLTKLSFQMISNLTASNPNIYQATWEHPFEVDPLRKNDINKAIKCG